MYKRWFNIPRLASPGNRATSAIAHTQSLSGEVGSLLANFKGGSIDKIEINATAEELADLRVPLVIGDGWKITDRARFNSGVASMVRCTGKVGPALVRHYHRYHDEMLVMIRGEMVEEISGIKISGGQAHWIARNTPHQVRALTKEVDYIVFFHPEMDIIPVPPHKDIKLVEADPGEKP